MPLLDQRGKAGVVKEQAAGRARRGCKRRQQPVPVGLHRLWKGVCFPIMFVMGSD